MKNIFRPSKSGPGREKRAIGAERLIFREFTESMNLIEDLDQLALNLLGRIKEAVRVERLAAFIYDRGLVQFRLAAQSGLDGTRIASVSFSPQDRLPRWLKINGTCLEIGKQPDILDHLGERESALFTEFGFELCFPLVSMNRLIGILCLGPKTDGRGFAKHELSFIESLTPQAGIAIENAVLYKEQRERLRRMIRADRLATIGELAAGAAHEIRNPLTAVKSALQYLAEKPRPDTEKKLLSIAIQETDRIDGILAALLSFSRPSEIKKEPCDLAGTIEESLALLSFQARSAGIETVTDLPPEHVFLNADKPQLKQLFLNVLLNAIQAMEGGGRLTCEVVPAGAGKVMVKVSDTGPGIPEEQMDRIFDPFFTTKKSGTGLGLSICYTIVKSHNGEIEIRSRAGEGTTVLLTLPVS